MELTTDQGQLLADQIVETEMHFLREGCIDPPAVNDAAYLTKLTTEHFAIPGHALLFRYICEIADSGEQFSKEKAAAQVTKWGGLIGIDDVKDIVKGLYTKMPCCSTPVELAQEIIDNFNTAEKYRHHKREMESTLDRDPRPTDSMAKARAPWATIGEIGKSEHYKSGLLAISTGYTCLDDALGGGLRQETLTTIAGRTGAAKTTIGLNIARLMALDGQSVLFFKLEESVNEAVWRMHSAAARVDFRRLLNNDATSTDKKNLDDGWDLLQTLPIRLSATRALEGIQRTARQHAAGGGKVIVIDQLSMIEVENSKIGYEQATIASNALRRLAVELRIPIVLLAQVNRVASKTGDHLTCNDLRDSGAIENDSAAVILIDRVRAPDHEYANSEPIRYLDLIIDKNRYGARTDPDKPITLNWYPRWFRVEGPEQRSGVPF